MSACKTFGTKQAGNSKKNLRRCRIGQLGVRSKQKILPSLFEREKGGLLLYRFEFCCQNSKHPSILQKSPIVGIFLFLLLISFRREALTHDSSNTYCSSRHPKLRLIFPSSSIIASILSYKDTISLSDKSSKGERFP